MRTAPTAFFCKMIVDISFPVATCTTAILPTCESQLYTLGQAFIEVTPATAWVQPVHSGVTWFSRD